MRSIAIFWLKIALWHMSEISSVPIPSAGSGVKGANCPASAGMIKIINENSARIKRFLIMLRDPVISNYSLPSKDYFLIAF
jgi:hypothetical protein